MTTVTESKHTELKQSFIENYCFDGAPEHYKYFRKELDELKISNLISPFSYMKGKYVYLEEDGDCLTFIKATKKITKYLERNVEEHYTNRNIK